MKSIELTSENISEHIISSEITVVNFWGDWCPLCKTLGPIIDSFAEANCDVSVGKLSVGSYGTVAASYGIRTLPTLIFFKGGVVVKKTTGLKTLEKLQGIISELK